MAVAVRRYVLAGGNGKLTVLKASEAVMPDADSAASLFLARNGKKQIITTLRGARGNGLAVTDRAVAMSSTPRVSACSAVSNWPRTKARGRMELCQGTLMPGAGVQEADLHEMRMPAARQDETAQGELPCR